MFQKQNIIFENTNVRIIQHSDCAHGFFYYTLWKHIFHDEFGYYHGLKNWFWIVDDFGNLVPRETFLYAEENSQQDDIVRDFLGISIISKLSSEQIILLNKVSRLINLKLTKNFTIFGKVVHVVFNNPTSKISLRIEWENKTKEDIKINDFDLLDFYSLD